MNIHADFAAFQKKLKNGASYEKRDAPSLEKIAETIEKTALAFEAHKKATDDSLAELKKSGTISPETQDKIDRIGREMDQLSDIKRNLEILQTRSSRPGNMERGNAPCREAQEYRSAFESWVRDPRNGTHEMQLREAHTNLQKRNAALETRSTQTVTSTPAAGGFALPEQIAAEIDRLSVDISPIRSVAKVVKCGTPDYKELIDIGGAGFEWLGEADTRNQTNTPDLYEVAPSFGMASAKPQASEESMTDLFFNVESWLIESASEALALGEGAAFISGNGVKKPTGILAAPAPVATADTTRAFGTLQYLPSLIAGAMPASADTFLDMIYALRARYRANARWMSAKSVIGSMRKYKDSTGQYLWQPSLQIGQPDMFMGYPVTEAEDMPVVAANAFPLAFGDFRQGYLIADLVELRMTRDEITTPGFVKFYIRKRVGGKLRNTQAIKLLKIATA